MSSHPAHCSWAFSLCGGSRRCQRGCTVSEAAAGPPQAGASVADGPGVCGQPPGRVSPSWGCAANADPWGPGAQGPFARPRDMGRGSCFK